MAESSLAELRHRHPGALPRSGTGAGGYLRPRKMLHIRAARRRHLLLLAAVAFFSFCAYTLFQIPPKEEPRVEPPPKGPPPITSWGDDGPTAPGSPQPKKVPGTDYHPVSYLISTAEREFKEMTQRQSKTLQEAVAEYRKRYGIPPPPHFDEWFRFAKDNGVKLIDEFDTIHDLITPFWGLKPKTIRSRAKEALGFDNGLCGVAIRDHQVTFTQGGLEWQQNATRDMIQKFIKFLPDMDLGFNIHDEPRVVVPHEDLAMLISKARDHYMPAANAVKAPVNDFSRRAPELNDGRSFEETSMTRFTEYPRQHIWSDSRLSCPPDTPARQPDEDERFDELSKYGMGDLGFVYNQTALSDICLTPSLGSNYGFFDGPNAYRISHDLYPIFSQSKISSYNDLIYPSPWYWNEMVPYDDDKDVEWAKKEAQLYWRGSTTGGFSRNGRWRRHHRQRLVRKLSSVEESKIMTNKGTPEAPHWEASSAPRGDFKDLIDVHFSHIGQCDQGDCDAQIEFFQPLVHVDQSDAWKYKYLLDMDGNGFSGRFYAFLKSRSLIFKFAIFREWHNEWIKPWVHYIPFSLRGDDWLEAVRYFHDGDGAADAERVATTSREWAHQGLRQVDMETWFFRLLLEYARVIDEKREEIGFDLASSDKKMPAAAAESGAPPEPEQQGN